MSESVRSGPAAGLVAVAFAQQRLEAAQVQTDAVVAAEQDRHLRTIERILNPLNRRLLIVRLGCAIRLALCASGLERLAILLQPRQICERLPCDREMDLRALSPRFSDRRIQRVLKQLPHDRIGFRRLPAGHVRREPVGSVVVRENEISVHQSVQSQLGEPVL